MTKRKERELGADLSVMEGLILGQKMGGVKILLCNSLLGGMMQIFLKLYFWIINGHGF